MATGVLLTGLVCASVGNRAVEEKPWEGSIIRTRSRATLAVAVVERALRVEASPAGKGGRLLRLWHLLKAASPLMTRRVPIFHLKDEASAELCKAPHLPLHFCLR